MPDPARIRRPLVAAALLLGGGMGGFVDGILFHQILQLHNMLSARYPTTGPDPAAVVANLEVNMVWDGLFHAATWAATAAGLVLLFRAGGRADVDWSGRAFAGGLLAGWGLFNFVEGLIDHHLLHVHHVVEGPGHLVWDVLFLMSGVALIAGGLALLRRPGSAHPG